MWTKIFKSLLISAIISATIAFTLWYWLPFWPTFIIVLFCQFFLSSLIKYGIDSLADIEFSKNVVALEKELAKQQMECTCEYCIHKQYVLINLNGENSFICKKCGNTNKVLLEVQSVRTTNLEKKPTNNPIQSEENIMQKDLISERDAKSIIIDNNN